MFSVCLDAAEYREVWEADCASRLQHGKASGQYPGCTALVVLLVGSDLYVANAGEGAFSVTGREEGNCFLVADTSWGSH
jgi:hypothetical protein